MNRQRIVRLTPIDRVLARVAALTRPVAPYDIAIEDAQGRILAEDVASPVASPATPIALRDGWAVRADQVADAGPYAPMPLGCTFAWVNAGDALPPGTDTVLPPDAVSGNEAHASATAGDGTLAAAADFSAGQILRRGGDRLRAADVAVLRAAGIARVVIRGPLVRIAYTGDDVAARVISRAVAMRGANVMLLEGLDAAFAADCDAVIAVGGTGEGHGDDSVARLARIGEVAVHGIGLRPGEATALGSCRGKPVLLLPSRLDATLAAFLVVGEALLRALSGATMSPRMMRVTLARKIVSTVGMAEVVPVRRTENGAEPLASGHWPLQALTQADGWVLVPPESEGFPSGTDVEMRAFP